MKDRGLLCFHSPLSAFHTSVINTGALFEAMTSNPSAVTGCRTSSQSILQSLQPWSGSSHHFSFSSSSLCSSKSSSAGACLLHEQTEILVLRWLNLAMEILALRQAASSDGYLHNHVCTMGSASGKFGRYSTILQQQTKQHNKVRVTQYVGIMFNYRI